jgi:hypothetical protein
MFEPEKMPAFLRRDPVDGEAPAAAGPNPAAAPGRTADVEPADAAAHTRLDDIALQMRALLYPEHLALAAGLLQCAGIQPDFGAQQHMAQLLHKWAMKPPANPTVAFPSAASSPPLSPKAAEPAAAERPRPRRQKSRASRRAGDAAPLPGAGEGSDQENPT